MFRWLRRYALFSLVGMLVTAVLLTALYRQLQIRDSIEFEQKSSLALAQTILNALKPQLGEYLKSTANSAAQEISGNPFPSSLASKLAELMKKASLAKLSIYNNRGVAVYSTHRRDVGSIDQFGSTPQNEGYAPGNIAYRDMFGAFGQSTSTENTLRTAVPIRLGPAEPVLGTLVTLVDLSPVVEQNEQAVLAAFGGILSVLMLLYAVLLLLVMRAKKYIETQHKTIRERTATLETLSVQLPEGEETKKLNSAVNLHQGLAQTLAAIKARIEDSLEQAPSSTQQDKSLHSALLALDGAIEELQEIAADLRPSSLDQLGLLPTIRWFCREFEYLHPDIRIEQQISLLEKDIPVQLKIVIYRIVEAVLKDIGNNSQKDRIRISLRPEGKGLVLAIDDVPQDLTFATGVLGFAKPNPKLRFAAVKERATLSGGAFTAIPNVKGGVSLHASWAA